MEITALLMQVGNYGKTWVYSDVTLEKTLAMSSRDHFGTPKAYVLMVSFNSFKYISE